MSPPAVITKATGHLETIALAGDTRYLCEIESHGNWQFIPLTPEQIEDLIGKNRRLFEADPGGPIIRVEPETILTRGRNGVMRRRRTGKISTEYARKVEQLQAQGKTIYQRIVTGTKALDPDHGYTLARPRGTVVPLTWTARLQAQERGWKEAMPIADGRKLLGRILRDSIKPHAPIRRAIRTITSEKKVGRSIVAHNLVVAPHPRILKQILRAGQPVDKVLETAARRAIEKIERRMKGKITAVCSTHLEDSTTVRPHLHVRLSAYDSNGNYVRLFDRKAGGGGGGRCVLQDDIEREIKIIIERDQPRERE